MRIITFRFDGEREVRAMFENDFIRVYGNVQSLQFDFEEFIWQDHVDIRLAIRDHDAAMERFKRTGRTWAQDRAEMRVAS